jgi:hypothetical protein
MNSETLTSETSHSQTSLVSASKIHLFFHGATAPSELGPSHYRGFKINLTHTTLSRTPLDEWSARRRDNTQHSPQTSAPWRNSNPKSQKASGHITHVLDRAANGLGFKFIHRGQFRFIKLWILCLIRLVVSLYLHNFRLSLTEWVDRQTAVPYNKTAFIVLSSYYFISFTSQVCLLFIFINFFVYLLQNLTTYQSINSLISKSAIVCNHTTRSTQTQTSELTLNTNQFKSTVRTFLSPT